MSPHSRIVPFSGDHHEKIARDEWMDGQRHRQKRQSTTVHDSSMEVSGSGSRRDRPTALDRPPRPTATPISAPIVTQRVRVEHFL